MEKIRLNLIPTGPMPVVHVSQYDQGRQIRVFIFDGSKPYIFTDETVEVNVRKRDRKIVTADLEVTSGTRYVDIVTTQQMCAVAGKNEAEIKITKGIFGPVVATLNFIIDVERSPMENGLESDSEINNLARQVHDDVVQELAGHGAEDTGFNNAYSGLNAENVQDAIDEVNDKVNDIPIIDAYSKTEADNKFATKTALNNLSSVVDGKANKTYVDEKLETKADAATTYTKTQVDDIANSKANANAVYSKDQTYNKTEVDNKIAELPEAMVLKGTLGVNGTIQSLPTPSASNEGYTYKCITAGTYSGLTLKVGDTVTCYNPEGTSTYEWFISGYGDTDTDTWRAIKINGTEVLGNGISSGSVDIVEGDNINITFDGNGNKVEIEADTIDDTQVLENKAWSSKKTFDEIFNILPTGNASGSIANFNTSLALPMEIVADVNATQEAGTPTPQSPKAISGVSAVSVIHCGKNLAYLEQGSINISDGNEISATNRVRTDYIVVKYGENYIDNTGLIPGWIIKNGCGYDKNKNYISNGIYPHPTTHKFSFNNPNIAFVRFIYGLADNADCSPSDYNYQFELGSTASSYEPYNGSTTLINLGGTYYGGYVSQDKNGKRELVVTCAIYNLTGSEQWTVTGTGTSVKAFIVYDDYNIHKKPVGSAQSYLLSNRFAKGNAENSGEFDMGIMYLRFNIYGIATTKEEFNAWILNNPTSVLFELAEPFTVELPDGEPIIAFNGVNNVYTDSGDCEVTYKKSIDDAIAELQALILS